MRHFLWMVALCFISWSARSQTGTIKGLVTTSDGEAAAFVNISLKGTDRGSTTNRQGQYEIRNVPVGNYTLVASFIGLKTKTRDIQVVAGKTVQADFALNEDARQLRRVTVLSARERLPDEPDDHVAKIPLTNLENPQVYSSVSSKIIREQLIANYDDIFRNVPGIYRSWESTGRNGDGASYFGLRGLETQPGLVNGLPGITNGDMDPAGVEEVQVMKGPSATLFGPNSSSYASYGGIINTIMKKPYFRNGGELGYIMGSFGLNRFTADLNTLLSKENKVAARVNMAYQTEGSFQDAGYKKIFYVAPTLAYEVNDRLSFLVTSEIMAEERVVAPVFFHSNRAEPLTFKNIEELNLNPELSFTSNDLPIKNPRTNIQAQMNYKLSEHWKSQTAISRGTSRSQGYYDYIWPDEEGDNYFQQYFTYVNEQNVSTDIQQNFNGDFHIGAFRNRLVVGLDFFSKQSVNNGLGYVLVRNVTPQGAVSYTDPSTGDEVPPVYLSRAAIDALLAKTEPANSKSKSSTYAAYVADVINLLPNLDVMMGVRMNYFHSDGEVNDPEDDYHQVAFSPKFGVVYQPLLNKISIFANYQNGFYQVDPVQVADPDGSHPRLKSFEPEQANQWEAGVKLNVWKDRLFATLSYYDIRVKNKVIGDQNNFYNSIQGGEIESKGFEMELKARLWEGMNLIAGYSHNHVQNVKGNKGDFYSEPGRVPGGQGPADLLNFWATYRIPKGKLKNFGIGLGGNHASPYRVIDNSVTGVFDLPAYTVLNAALFYDAGKFRFSLNVNNFTDEQYYIGYWSVNPQKPVNFAAGMSWKF